jgi:hypothetical protein
MQKALSVKQIMSKKYKTFNLSRPFFEAFDKPEYTGIWFIWGNSGNGKTSFVLQLARELARHCRVAYNSLEEGDSKTMQNAFKLIDMSEVNRRFILVNEPIEDFSVRLQKKQKAPHVGIIDSFQYAGMNYHQYKAFKELHRNKLIIFVSHADGRQPLGRAAKSVRYDASLKIWVEGYQAHSSGRYIGPNGGIFTIWEEGHRNFMGNNMQAQ